MDFGPQHQHSGHEAGEALQKNEPDQPDAGGAAQGTPDDLPPDSQPGSDPTDPGTDLRARRRVPGDAPTWSGDAPGQTRVDTVMPRPIAASATSDVLGWQTRYEVLETVGSGGMGTVFRAIDLRTRRIVAIKVLKPRHDRNAVTRARLEAEAVVVAQLDHPNVVRLFEVLESPTGQLALVTEFISGWPLSQSPTPMPAPEALAIIRQVAKALGAAHALGVVHRDVKPENILLDVVEGEVRARLCDWGIARDTRSGAQLTEAGAFVGTARYASPEQCRCDLVGESSDFYSLAVVLYELLSGQPLFDASTEQLWQRKHISATPTLAGLPVELPRGVRSLLRSCLSKRPEQRPEDATELIRRIDECLAALANPRRGAANWLVTRPELVIFSLATLVFSLWLVLGSGRGDNADRGAAGSDAPAEEADDADDTAAAGRPGPRDDPDDTAGSGAATAAIPTRPAEADAAPGPATSAAGRPQASRRPAPEPTAPARDTGLDAGGETAQPPLIEDRPVDPLRHLREAKP